MLFFLLKKSLYRTLMQEIRAEQTNAIYKQKEFVMRKRFATVHTRFYFSYFVIFEKRLTRIE